MHFRLRYRPVLFGVVLFCSTSSDQEHTAMSSTASAALAGRVARTLTARLRLRCTGWSTSQHPREASVGAERCSTRRVLVAEVRPCDATSSTTSLVEDGAADRVQARSTCLPLLPRSGATVPCERTSKSVIRPWPTATSTRDITKACTSVIADCVSLVYDLQPPTPSSFRRPVSLSLSLSLSLSPPSATGFHRRRSPGVKQSAINCRVCTVTRNFQTTTQKWTFSPSLMSCSNIQFIRKHSI